MGQRDLRTIKRELDDSFTYLVEGGWRINTDDGDFRGAIQDVINLSEDLINELKEAV